jgi:hypothetical protein
MSPLYIALYSMTQTNAMLSLYADFFSVSVVCQLVLTYSYGLCFDSKKISRQLSLPSEHSLFHCPDDHLSHYFFFRNKIECKVSPIFRLRARLAQPVEHETFNLRVVGSSPTMGAYCFLKQTSKTWHTFST